MTGPDCLIFYGVSLAISVLAGMIVVAARLRERTQRDPAGQEADVYGAVEGGNLHNETGQ